LVRGFVFVRIATPGHCSQGKPADMQSTGS
jgi:hypothetical protein